MSRARSLRWFFKIVRSVPNAWRLTSIDIAAAEAEHTMVATCDAQLRSFRHVLAVLHEIEALGSEAMIELPAASDLMAAMVRARMEAVCDAILVGATSARRFSAAA